MKTIAAITATRCSKDTSDAVPTLRIEYKQLKIAADGTIHYKAEIEHDTGLHRKRKTGRWILVARLKEYVRQDKAKLQQVVEEWLQRLQQADYEVEVSYGETEN